MASAQVDPVSPELALVCPELRELALALIDELEAAAGCDSGATPPAWICAVAYASISFAVVFAQGVTAVSALVLFLTVLGG
jgi:hypothetical protein